MATFETEGFSMALEKIATDSAQPAYNPIELMYRIRNEMGVFHIRDYDL